MLLCCNVHTAFSIAVSADFVGTRYLQPPVYGARQTSSRFSISERNNTLRENSHQMRKNELLDKVIQF